MKAVYFLLDRSASMQNLWTEALSSINAYVKQLQDPNTYVLLATFDSLGYDVIRNTKAIDWLDITNNDATPRGGTPLFDSAVRMMHHILDDKPERAVFVTMTDGEENQSQMYKQHHVKQLVSKLQEKNFEIVFLGANFDKVGDVATHNFGLNNTKFWDTKPGQFSQTMGAFASASSSYLNNTTREIDMSNLVSK